MHNNSPRGSNYLSLTILHKNSVSLPPQALDFQIGMGAWFYLEASLLDAVFCGNAPMPKRGETGLVGRYYFQLQLSTCLIDLDHYGPS